MCFILGLQCSNFATLKKRQKTGKFYPFTVVSFKNGNKRRLKKNAVLRRLLFPFLYFRVSLSEIVKIGLLYSVQKTLTSTTKTGPEDLL